MTGETERLCMGGILSLSVARPPPANSTIRGRYLAAYGRWVRAFGKLHFLIPNTHYETGSTSLQLRCGPGSLAASSTASRHSRLSGKIGGIGATSGAAVGAAIESIFRVCEALRMKRL